MTNGGFGNTARTIWDSWATVARISPNSSARPDSVLGGLSSGLETVFHLA